MNEFRKLRVILTSSELKSAIVLLFLMFIGTILEMLGVGMMFPVMVVLGQNDLAVRHPIIKPILEYLGNPSQSQLIAGAMLGLLLVYMLKNLFPDFSDLAAVALYLRHLCTACPALVQRLPAPALYLSSAAQFGTTGAHRHRTRKRVYFGDQ